VEGEGAWVALAAVSVAVLAMEWVSALESG
jgi:hypothetical protein